MKIAEKQLLFLYQVAMDSVRIYSDTFTYAIKDRRAMVDEITNQQDDTLMDIGESKSISEPTLKPQYYKDHKKRKEE